MKRNEIKKVKEVCLDSRFTVNTDHGKPTESERRFLVVRLRECACVAVMRGAVSSVDWLRSRVREVCVCVRVNVRFV